MTAGDSSAGAIDTSAGVAAVESSLRVSAHFGSLEGAAGATTVGIRLVESQLEMLPRACAKLSEKTVCVRGALLP
jgi:hypothetical protein